MDIKSLTKSSQISRRPARRRTLPQSRKHDVSWVHRSLQDSCVLKTAWTAGLLSTNSTGTISSTIATSFYSFATEASPIASLYTESLLVKAVLVLAPINPNYTTRTHGKIDVGWNPAFNAITFSNPTVPQNIINLGNWTILNTSKLTVTYIPDNSKNYVWNILTDTNPQVSRGDCGAWVCFGSGLTASTDYFSAQVHCIFKFRGRI